MEEKFKVGFKSHIQNGGSILLLILVAVAFAYGMSVKTGDKIEVFICISGVMFTLLCGPAIIVHLNYYKINKGYTFSYKRDKGEITIGHNGQYDTFNTDDIEHIDRFMSYNLAANRSGVVPWDEYNHSVIYLENGKKFTVTSLLVPNLNLPIPGDKINIKQSLYRLAKKL